MSLAIECLECDYEGKVSPAKAGKTILCPSCSEPIQIPVGKAGGKRSSAASGRRPKTDNLSVPLIALVGATVLLGGIVTMYMIKKAQMDEDYGVVTSDLPTSLPTEAGTKIPAVKPTVPKTVPTDSSPKNSNAESGSESTTTVPSQTSDNEPADSLSDFILPEISAVDPRLLLLADMDEVMLDVSSMPEDSRGAIQKAVGAIVKSELAKCRLKCSEDESKPKVLVKLNLRKVGGLQKLVLDAEMQGEMSGVPVTIWENEAALLPVDKKALNGSIAIPGLGREVGQFFNSLRDKITTARTTINSIKENQRRRQEAKDKEAAATGEG